MSKRGRPVINPTELEKPIKFERRYEDDESITVWKYDLNKSSSGPIEVNIAYKNNIDKNWEKRAKEAKEDRRTERQMKKINEKKSPKTKTGKRGRPKKK
jgi:hypothetical protein